MEWGEIIGLQKALLPKKLCVFSKLCRPRVSFCEHFLSRNSWNTFSILTSDPVLILWSQICQLKIWIVISCKNVCWQIWISLWYLLFSLSVIVLWTCKVHPSLYTWRYECLWIVDDYCENEFELSARLLLQISLPLLTHIDRYSPAWMCCVG